MSPTSSRHEPNMDRVARRWTGNRSSVSFVILVSSIAWTVWTRIQNIYRSSFFPRSARRACEERFPTSPLCSGKVGPSGPPRANRSISNGETRILAGPHSGPTNLISTACGEAPGLWPATEESDLRGETMAGRDNNRVLDVEVEGNGNWCCVLARERLGRWALCTTCSHSVELREFQHAPPSCKACGNNNKGR